MLRRLLLALLTLCLALPAAAMPLEQRVGSAAPQHAAMSACHEQQAPVDPEKQHQPPRGHDCIGCIAPLCRVPAMPAALLPLTPPRIAALVDSLSGTARAPETPPPRP